MSSNAQSCPICARPPQRGVTMRNGGSADSLRVDCPLCGTYFLNGHAIISETYAFSPTVRQSLSCATRQASEAARPLHLDHGNFESFALSHSKTRVADNLDRLLRVAADRAGRPNGGARFTLADDFTLIDCFSWEEFQWYLDWLAGDSLVLHTITGPGAVHLSLTLAGWNRVQPLATQGGKPGQCFVAMWFSPDMDLAFEAGFVLGIEDAGFKPLRLDRKEFNNQIPDEIIAEIRNSEFVVADFTGQRGNVYYEAGFAMGLGRKVIWTCREDHLEGLLFDTSHQNHLSWSTPEELRFRLRNRIRATILDTA